MTIAQKEIFVLAEEKSAGQPYPVYIQNLKQVGVTGYTVNVADHFRTIYFSDGSELALPGAKTYQESSDTFSEELLREALNRTQTGLSSYADFLAEIAAAGVHVYEADLVR